MIEQLQDEKEKISCKLIEEQEKVEDVIKNKDREIDELKGKEKNDGFISLNYLPRK